MIYAQIDCDLPRDTKMIAAGPMARLLYVQCVLYCRENLTDGKIERLLLPLIALDITSAVKHMGRLVDVGAMELTEYGWRIPEHVWRRRNPLKSEVDEKRKAEADRKKSQRDNKRSPENVPLGHRVESEVCPGQGEGEGKPAAKPKPFAEPSEKPAAAEVGSNSSPDDPANRAAAAVQILIDHRICRSREPIADEDVYGKRIRATLTDVERAGLERESRTGATPEVIAERVFGIKPPAPPAAEDERGIFLPGTGWVKLGAPIGPRHSDRRGRRASVTPLGGQHE